MNRKKTESKYIFRKQLVLFLIMILLPTIMLLSLQIIRTSRSAVSQTGSISKNYLDRATRNLDLLLDQLDQISLQISLNPGILDMLNRPFDLQAYQYAQNKELLRNWMTSNSLFYSLYVKILQNGKVLTTNEGLYNDSSTFYDQAFLDQVASSSLTRMAPWVGSRYRNWRIFVRS